MGKIKIAVENSIREVKERIVEQFHPTKIIIFGSHAAGTPGPDSDLDILVIMPVEVSRRQKAVQIDLALEGIKMATDILVATPDEVNKYQNWPGTVICQAIREGKVIYDSAA